MGFFSRLFGGKEEKEKKNTDQLPVQSAELTGQTQLRLTEILEPGHSGQLNQRISDRKEARNDPTYSGDLQDEEIVDRIQVRYQLGLDYVIVDEALLQESIGEDEVGEALNELFYVSLTEFNSITVKIIEGDTQRFEEELLEQLNAALQDWGVEGKRLEVKSIAPTEEYMEFYAAYKEVWG